MAKDVLYGVKMVVLTEVDPTTQLPKVESPTICKVDSAEEVEMEPVISEGTEEHKRDDSKILAVVSTPDLLYGYNLKLTDNTFDLDLAGLVEGADVTGEQLNSPMMAEGSKMKPFMLTLYVANYEGNSIKNYVKIDFNLCTGTPGKMTVGKNFFTPEFTIKAREATKAAKPIKSISYVDTLPA